jgi:hypothetical protein
MITRDSLGMSGVTMPLDPRADEPLGEVAITRAGPAGLIVTASRGDRALTAGQWGSGDHARWTGRPDRHASRGDRALPAGSGGEWRSRALDRPR